MIVGKYILTGFGLQVLRPKLYAPTSTGLEAVIKDYPEADVEVVTNMNTDADDQAVLSYLGTPIWADLQLRSKDGSLSVLMDMVLVDVGQARRIVETFVEGRPGSIKEYIADGDFEFTIRGALVSQDAHSYPREEVSTLIALLKLPEAVEVISPYVQLFGVYDLVVFDYRFPQQEGFQNMQLFEITAKSDLPIELVEDA